MKPIKNKHLNKCMKVIINHCDNERIPWSDKDAQDFCNDTENLNVLYALSGKVYINLIKNLSSINGVFITSKGLCFFQEKEQERKDYIKNFFIFSPPFSNGCVLNNCCHNSII